MSVSVGQAKLKNAFRDLAVHWEEVRNQWNDPRSRQVEREILEPLEPHVRSALGAMDRMNAQIAQAERDCS